MFKCEVIQGRSRVSFNHLKCIRYYIIPQVSNIQAFGILAIKFIYLFPVTVKTIIDYRRFNSVVIVKETHPIFSDI